MVKRIGEGLVGALLGAVIGVGLGVSFEGGVEWSFVLLVMAICFALGSLCGGRFLQWVADLIHHAW